MECGMWNVREGNAKQNQISNPGRVLYAFIFSFLFARRMMYRTEHCIDIDRGLSLIRHDLH